MAGRADLHAGDRVRFAKVVGSDLNLFGVVECVGPYGVFVVWDNGTEAAYSWYAVSWCLETAPLQLAMSL